MSKNVLMTIGGNESSFAVEDKQDVVFLPVGFDLVSLRYFKHSPPTYDDIEYAINYIEDEIERVAKKVPYDGYSLVTDQPFIRDLAKLSGAVGVEGKGRFQRDDLERLFGLYAEIAAGRPAQSDESDTSVTFYAQLLIFREFMHHLKFEYIVVR